MLRKTLLPQPERSGFERKNESRRAGWLSGRDPSRLAPSPWSRSAAHNCTLALDSHTYLLTTPEIRPSASNTLFVFALPAGWQTITRRTPADAPALADATVTASATQPALGSPQTATQCAKPAPVRKSAASSRTPNGLFSAEQSERGRGLYLEQQCSQCHGSGMLGGTAPALADRGFRQAWQGRSLGALFDCIKSTMPPGRAGALTDQQYLHLLAAILESNGVVSATQGMGFGGDVRKLNEIIFGGIP